MPRHHLDSISREGRAPMTLLGRVRDGLWTSRSRTAVVVDLLLIGIAIGFIFASSVRAEAANQSASTLDAVSLKPAGKAPTTHGPIASGLGTQGPGPDIPEGAVPVPSMFTATSRTYKLPEGPYFTTFYSVPVNTKDSNGQWVAAKAPDASSRSAHAAAPNGFGENPPNAQDCTLVSKPSTKSFCASPSDTVGHKGSKTEHTLIRFEINFPFSDINVLNAELGLYLFKAKKKRVVSVTAYAATKPWTEAATWSTYDGSNAWSTPGGDFTTTNAVANPSIALGEGWQLWYPTQIVQEWVNGTLPNDGLLLEDSTAEQPTDLLSFDSTKASSDQPCLTVSWVPRGQSDQPTYTTQPFPVDESSTMKVNLASGDLFVTSTDLSYAGPGGPPLLVEHNYDSRNREGGTVNPWTSLPKAHVYRDGSVEIGIPRYDYATFIRQSNGFLTPRGIEATLCEVNETTCTANKADKDSAAYALTFTNNGNGPLYEAGDKLTFGSTGGILSEEDTSGHAIVYPFGDENGKPVTTGMTNSEGRTFTRHFHILSSGYPVTSEWEDTTSHKEVDYEYNSHDYLETYTDAEGHKTRYTYDEEGDLSEIIAPNGNVIKLSYTPEHLVTKVSGAEEDGFKGTWEYKYYKVGQAPAPCTSSQKGTVVTEIAGHEEPPITYCANVFDEVEKISGYPVVGQDGGYLSESEPVGEAASISVDLASGNLSVGEEDLLVEHEGEAEVGPMVLNRYYNSLGPTDTKSLGARWNWSTGPGVYLVNYGASVVVHGRNGYAVPLTRVSATAYATPGEFEGTLIKNTNGTFTLSDADGPTYEFDAAGTLISETPEAGETETVSNTEVGGATVLHKLTAANGTTFEVGYDSAGRVADVKGPTGEAVYGYNSAGQLASYTAPSGAKTEYGYGTGGYLDKIVTAEGTESIAIVNGKVSEVSDKPAEGPASATQYTYESPQSPTCNPATDTGETVVTTTTEGEPEPSVVEALCYNAAGEFTGPRGTAEAEEEEGTEIPPEETSSCSEDVELHREDCVLEEGRPEEPEDLARTDYGISDNNWLQGRGYKEEHFDYLSQPLITGLHVTKYRRNVPWDLVTEAEHNEEKPGDNLGAKAELEDVEEWIKLVKEAGAEPYVAFEDECPTPKPPEWANPGKLEANDTHPCEQAPTQAQYAQAVEKFLKPLPQHAILGDVKYFEALNEPDNETQTEGIYVKPTYSATVPAYPDGHDGGWVAGEYWRALDDMCAKTLREQEHRPECYVAAGDFLDSAMKDAWKNNGDGYAYFHQYLDGMGGKAKEAYRWSWHAYEEGEETRLNYRDEPKRWWRPFLLFQKAVDRVMEHAKYKYPNIWLSEQGVEYFLKGKPHIAWLTKGAGSEIMSAFVDHGSEQLTHQFDPVTKKSQITRFFYYSTRGAPGFDSGLLEAEKLPAGRTPKYGHVNRPRPIYGIYAKKTPGG